MIHAAGSYESRGRILGFLFGSTDGLLLGGYKGTTQSRLSRAAAPPKKMPYVAPVLLWLLGFLVLMAFDARGKLSWMIGMLSLAYLLLLPSYLFGSLFYNLFVHPEKHKNWEQKFMCQRCGTLVCDAR